MSAMDMFEKGGPVVWILAAYSVIALVIVIERYIHFFLMGKIPQDWEDRVFSGGALGEAPAEKFRGPEMAVVREMLRAMRGGVHDLGRVASRIGSDELRRMERGLRTLAFIGATAPLLGLFGTITGMIKAFMVIEKAGGKVDAQALAGGIWEAMITTGVGLAVCIPALFLLHLLEGMADSRAASMKRVASIVIENFPARPGYAAEPAPDVVRHREGVMDGV